MEVQRPQRTLLQLRSYGVAVAKKYKPGLMLNTDGVNAGITRIMMLAIFWFLKMNSAEETQENVSWRQMSPHRKGGKEF